MRHTTGAHLLQSGVDISVIALWLGHESTETTHVYVEADLAAKERALQKLAPLGANGMRFKPTDRVLAFLDALWSQSDYARWERMFHVPCWACVSHCA